MTMNNTDYTFGTYFEIQNSKGISYPIFIVAARPGVSDFKMLHIRVKTEGVGWVSSVDQKNTYKELDLEGSDRSLTESLILADKFAGPIRSIVQSFDGPEMITHPFYFVVSKQE